jgi:UDP-3-O-[3-hydroxymyristoyl] glucosamine N-acyltransferase LpxD
VRIGRGTIVRAGAVLGAEGFEHKRTSRGILSVRHDGEVIIGERVEIGANCAISKGFSFRHTVIDDETRLDNLVHVAHGAQIGKRCFLPASCMIAGSTTIHDDVWIGPNASVSSQVQVGEGAYVTIGAVVTRDVPAGQRMTGNFAVPHAAFLSILKRNLRDASTE